jgi:hypothetical protein
VQIVKIYPQTILPRNTEHIWSSDWIPEAFVGHVRAPPYPRASQLTRLLTRVLERFSEHVRPYPVFQRLSLRTGLVRFPGQVPVRVARHVHPPRLRHVRVSDTPTGRFSWGAIKRSPRLTNPAGQFIHLRYTLRHSLEL